MATHSVLNFWKHSSGTKKKKMILISMFGEQRISHRIRSEEVIVKILFSIDKNSPLSRFCSTIPSFDFIHSATRFILLQFEGRLEMGTHAKTQSYFRLSFAVSRTYGFVFISSSDLSVTITVSRQEDETQFKFKFNILLLLLN